MATKKTTPCRGFKPIDEIGFDRTQNAHGGLENNPAVVLAIHPVIGTTVFGPFRTIRAARAWAADDAETDVALSYGSSKGWVILAASMDVPGNWD